MVTTQESKFALSCAVTIAILAVMQIFAVLKFGFEWQWKTMVTLMILVMFSQFSMIVADAFGSHRHQRSGLHANDDEPSRR